MGPDRNPCVSTSRAKMGVLRMSDCSLERVYDDSDPRTNLPNSLLVPISLPIQSESLP